MNLELSKALVTAMSSQRRLARLGGHVQLLPSHAGECIYAPDAKRSSYRVIVCGMTQEVYVPSISVWHPSFKLLQLPTHDIFL